VAEFPEGSGRASERYYKEEGKEGGTTARVLSSQAEAIVRTGQNMATSY